MGPEGDRLLPETVVVGWIRKPHGVRGEVAVEVVSDLDGRFDVGSSLLLKLASGETRDVRVASRRPHRDALLVRFEGHDSRDDVEVLRSGYLEVARDSVPPSPTGTFYHFELVGCRCVDSDRGPLGEVVDLIEDGGGLLLEIDAEGKRLLIPFVEAYLRSVDVRRGSIELDLPPGLVETCTSTS